MRMERKARNGLFLTAALVSLVGCPMTASDMGMPDGGDAPGGSGAPGAPGASPFSLIGNDAVYTQGNLGLGTETPAERLDVAGNAKVVGTVFADAFSSNSPLQLQTAGTTRIYVDDVTGNVGIGTSTPGSLLTIQGADMTQQLLRTTSPTGLTSIRFENSGGAGTGEAWYDPTANAFTIKAIPANSTLNLLGNNNRGIVVNASGRAHWIGPGPLGGGVSIGTVNDDYSTISYSTTGGSNVRARVYQSHWRFIGDVGIDREPTANKLEINGNHASKSIAGDWSANSDARIKKDVNTITSALETIRRVRLVSFRYTDEYRAAHPEIEDRAHINVIAQEFREVFPDHVQSSGERLADGSEILQVDPYPLTIYSAAAVQELHGLLERQADRLRQLESENNEYRERLALIEKRLGDMTGLATREFE